MIASCPLGTMFQLTGTAATQTCRTAAPAGAAERPAAPIAIRAAAATVRLTAP
jgi:hypothetical protein